MGVSSADCNNQDEVSLNYFVVLLGLFHRFIVMLGLHVSMFHRHSLRLHLTFHEFMIEHSTKFLTKLKINRQGYKTSSSYIVLTTKIPWVSAAE